MVAVRPPSEVDRDRRRHKRTRLAVHKPGLFRMTERHAGFTGTREGMPRVQKIRVAFLLMSYDWLHHGDCIGADAQAHNLALAMDMKVSIHPPTVDTLRAWCRDAHLVWPARPYLIRDRDIVDICSRLIAAPKSSEEDPRSGTWTTIRYAMKVGRATSIVLPNGEIIDRA
jgi:hypothetical protein